ncbi:hypothetical protein TWF173_001854 [Orbilia oligospora]|uniref:Nuclease S1 n=2 Tax=Orbilia oligospora TaxID=2813651 RepID=G1XA99_ARTOA|nr:hypothetical protein AOL_s00076g557 [Orbilia oligospora ATCC 24927]EGX49916.1 hypothetical protein AOL_s00076g557 [Orbilia oligospora ATCC 24927]KAF3279495.1 hypothetical protein TWF970_004048 [Orbilia oligospora]KAF3316569.1 hypothetical protein TWF173_001854 [Orbilia oligospora]
MKASTFLAPLLLTTGVYSWGPMGHATVAYIAQHYLDGAARILTSHLLSGASLPDIASWADSYRYTDGGAFSQVFHYIDAHDQVPHKCNIKMERDCPPEGCIVTAIANYTERILNDDLSFSERADALKFVIHFIGDVQQPLHTENLAVGGNEITVFWGNESVKTNLHAAWDRNIPETLAGGSTIATSASFANSIIQDLETGIYSNLKKDWTSCGSIKRGIGCPKAWAQDANKIVCSDVLPNGVEEVQNKDISGAYYERNKMIARQQIAKGGYRLGLWLNKIAKAEQLKCRA